MKSDKKYVNAILISSDWDIQHRKHMLRELFNSASKWSDFVLIQQPVCLLGHLFTSFHRKILGLIKRNYKTTIIEDKIILYTPIMIFNYALWTRFKFMAIIDSYLLKIQINKFLENYFQGKKVIFWVFYPSHYYLVDKIKYDFLIYDHYDYFDYEPSGKKLYRDANFNDLLIKKCDFILCLAKTVYERVNKINKKVLYFKSGCDFDSLSNANVMLNKVVLENINKPIIGYFGNIRHWFDFKLLIKVISELDNIHFVFIGHLNRDSIKDFKTLLNYKNVSWLHYMEQKNSNIYLKRFSAGIIPYKINNFMSGVFPNKVFEYLSVGIPVITTKLPELKVYDETLLIAESEVEFIKFCKDAALGKYKQFADKYIELAKQNRWSDKTDYLSEYLQNLFADSEMNKE